MKFCFLILLLLASGVAHSDQSEQETLDSQEPEKENTIWLEERISPTASWIESLVKPLTVWMEQKIHVPEQEAESSDIAQGSEGKSVSADQSGSQADADGVAASLISPKQASDAVTSKIEGDVLFIKLLQASKQYRVKLISKVGEIHIIYVNALSGEVISPDAKKVTANSATKVETTPGNQVSSEAQTEQGETE